MLQLVNRCSFVALLAFGCQSNAAPCSTRWPAHPVGVNLVDLPDTWKAPFKRGERGYGSDAARAQLSAAKKLGINVVVLPLTLYKSGHKVEGGPLFSRAGRKRLRRVIADAKERGMAVVLVPHLQIRGGGWRGDIAIAEADEFLRNYTKALLPIFDLAKDSCVDAFSVAVELKSLSQDPRADGAFASMVKSARGHYPGRLLYSANWDEVENVRHWALFDAIGVNAFFPLAEPGASDEEMRRGAVNWLRRYHAVAQREHKPLWLMELGYRANRDSFVEPWLWPGATKGVAHSADDQARAYHAALLATEETPVAFVAFWHWLSDGDDINNEARFEDESGFSFQGKPAADVVRTFISEDNHARHRR